MGNVQTNDSASIITPQQVTLPTPQPLNKTVAQTSPEEYNVFPYTNSVGRLNDYEYFNHLFMGEHWEAFSVRVKSKEYTKDYSKLRYVAINFAGLLSKVVADLLFSEPVTVKASENGDQEWIETFAKENRFDEQFYESALSNSALGDGLFKLRVGKRHENDAEPTVIFEDITPTIYFPDVDGFNIRSTPNFIELAWTFKVASKNYLRKEIHRPGSIEHRAYLMNGSHIAAEVDLSILGDPDLTGLGLIQETGIDRYMLIHIPNWKTANRHFGISDYYDLDKLFYAINNRITKIDNILDRHSDPILMVPDGVLDEDGNVNREALHMIEVPEGNGTKQKPEYIVWNANLDAAMVEIDKLLSFFMMTAEITPDILGMGQGLNDSGRALKFKLMRTIAKAQRKKLYYDRAIKEMVYVAQLLAKRWDLGIGPDYIKLKGNPEIPEITWQDGLPIDDYEEVTNETAKIDAGLQSKKQAIMNLDNIDEEAAEEKLEEINEENLLSMPEMGMNVGSFNDEDTAQNTDNTTDNRSSAPEIKNPQKPAGGTKKAMKSVKKNSKM